MATQALNTDIFADVILRCRDKTGKRKDIKCHKAVLIARSCLFGTLLESEDLGEENGYTVVLIKREPKYCEALVKYIYSSRYTATEGDSWADHLECAMLGSIHGLDGMESQALTAFEEVFEGNDPTAVAQMLENYDLLCEMIGYKSEWLDRIIEGLREKHIQDIIEDPYLASCSGDKDIMEKSLVHMVCLPKVQMHCETCGTRGTLYIALNPERCGKATTKRCKWVESQDGKTDE